MGNGFVQVPPQSTGKQVDGASLSVAGQTVIRQRVVIADNASSAGYAAIVGNSLQVRLDGSGTAIVAGSVGITGTAVVVGSVGITGAVVLGAGAANIGTINNISQTVTVQGNIGISSMPAVNISSMPAVVLGAGAANIGFINGISSTVNVAGTFTIGTINNISATVVVAGIVALAAGAANIGTVNGISAPVALAAGAANIGSINGISATVVVAGAVTLGAGGNNIGTINGISAAVALAAGTAFIGSLNGISATVNVAGTVVLGAGANNVGTVNGISATVTVAGVVRAYHGSLAVPSASHGPKVSLFSSSVGSALIAAPGAALNIYVDGVIVTNASATGTRFDAYDASNSAVPCIAGFCAASGGGFSHVFDPPIKLSANTALNARVKPNVSDVIVTINFHVE